jgi:hypothetical protein
MPPERTVAESMEFCPRFIEAGEASAVGVFRAAAFTVIDMELEAEELTGTLALSVTVQVTEYKPPDSLKE